MYKLLPVILLFLVQGALVAQVPQITQAPVGQTLTEGQTAQFTVVATGANLVYKWLKGGVPLTNGGRISGVDAITLTISGLVASDEGMYSVVVSVSGYPDVKTSSDGALLKVNAVTPLVPQITEHPQGKTVIEGQTLQFTVLATGLNLEYQWTKDSGVLVNGGRFSGANAATFKITDAQAADEGTYSVVVTISGYPLLKTSSNGALLKVNPSNPTSPIVLKHPIGQTVTSGYIARFTVLADGPKLIYQWARDGETLIDGGRISGAATPSLLISGAQVSDGGSYSVEVSLHDLPLLKTSSHGAMLLVIPPAPEIDIQQPKGSKLVDGKSKKSFGTVKIGKSGNSKTYTIKNFGTAKLTGLGIVKAGSHPNDFLVSKPLKASLPPGESTTFKVSFKPTKKGDRNAWIRIKSNDANENPFDIKLTGLGVKP